jgi:hypothetical protein
MGNHSTMQHTLAREVDPKPQFSHLWTCGSAMHVSEQLGAAGQSYATGQQSQQLRRIQLQPTLQNRRQSMNEGMKLQLQQLTGIDKAPIR